MALVRPCRLLRNLFYNFHIDSNNVLNFILKSLQLLRNIYYATGYSSVMLLCLIVSREARERAPTLAISEALVDKPLVADNSIALKHRRPWVSAGLT
jgi:hypothetical protein